MGTVWSEMECHSLTSIRRSSLEQILLHSVSFPEFLSSRFSSGFLPYPLKTARSLFFSVLEEPLAADAHHNGIGYSGIPSRVDDVLHEGLEIRPLGQLDVVAGLDDLGGREVGLVGVV